MKRSWQAAETCSSSVELTRMSVTGSAALIVAVLRRRVEQLEHHRLPCLEREPGRLLELEGIGALGNLRAAGELHRVAWHGQPRTMRAKAEWLWIDSKFSASTTYLPIR